MYYQTIKLQPYHEQVKRWPSEGRHIMAQYDETSVIVYQAYRPAIGRFAVENGYFGGEFSLNRMSWIKPNFLWMMYRCGWGTQPGQEVILAVRLQRQFFEDVLAQAVPSTYDPGRYRTKQAWQQAVKQSAVRLQWDPDHDPAGRKVTRRAIQLGLREDVLATYAQSALLEIIDVSDFVAQQRAHLMKGRYEDLITPQEHVYLPTHDD